MANNESKKPSAERFREAVQKFNGNLTKVADHFGVSRTCIYRWRDSDPKFSEAIRAERLKLYDEVLNTSRILALGIPKYEYELDANGEPVYDAHGNPRRRMVGWAVAPDSNMLRYIMERYGRLDLKGLVSDDEGGGVPVVDHGVNIDAWLEIRNQGTKRKKSPVKKKSK